MHRRRLLKLGAASALLLVVAGGSLALLQPALGQAKLSAAGRGVFHAVGRAILHGTLPALPRARDAALAEMLDRIDALVAGLPPHAQSELSQLLAILASGPGRRALAGLDKAWAEADAAAIQQALQGMRLSSLALRRQAYQALHDIVSGAYFSEPATWPLLGYPGPVAV